MRESHVRLVATPWTAAYQAPPSVGFSRQEYWSGLPLPSLLGLVMRVELILSLDTTGKSFLSPGQKFLCEYMSPTSNLVKMKFLM